jgi:hypothetical protein
MKTSFVCTAKSYSPGMVITHIISWTIFVSLLLIFLLAYESVNGAGYLHWACLVISLMGMSSQTTTLINQVIEEHNHDH